MLALLALASGAGLVGLIGFGLWNAVEQGRARAELDARTDARELARALKVALRTPDVLRFVPDGDRFSVEAGTVVVPDAVGWLVPRPDPGADPVVADKLRRAQLAEFAHGEGAEACALYDDLLGERGPRGDPGLEVKATAAWHAHRAGAVERRDGWLGELDAAFADAVPARCASPAFSRAVASTALLAAAAGRARARWTDRLVAALPFALARPVLARLAERGVDVRALAAAIDANAARRAQLVAVAALGARLGAEPAAFADGDALVLWFPAEPGGGAGARTAPALVAELHRRALDGAAGLPAMPEGGRVVFARPGSPHADEVVAGTAWVVPAPLPDAGWLARPGTVAAGAVLLVLVFAASAFFGVRAVRREALAMRARAEFLTGVTHELKTPVASIRLIAEALGDDPVEGARQREYFGFLASESARLAMLIENVLDLGQMERGERAYDLRPADLGAVVREAVATFRPVAERDGLAVELDAAAGTVAGTADRGAVQQALLNVLDNARKYAAAGGRVAVRTAVRRDAFDVVVRDFGPGVPAGERAAVFERFRRGAAHRHGSVPGVGLGLHLARAIARRHGGDLTCEAPADGGAGAVFRLTLPVGEGGAP